MSEDSGVSEDNRHAAGGPVVVDVGGDVGALVLRAPGELAGAEIEISGVDSPDDRSHVAVLARGLLGGGEVFAAVYPSLRQGQYVLWRPDGRPTAPVQVRGGAVTEVRWADVACPGAADGRAGAR